DRVLSINRTSVPQRPRLRQTRFSTGQVEGDRAGLPPRRARRPTHSTPLHRLQSRPDRAPPLCIGTKEKVMITLYYHRGACSTSNHFALEEAGVKYHAIEVHLDRPDDPIAIKVRELNPMAMTPVLVLADGTVLTQNAATLAYIADLVPEKKLLPARNTIDRAQAEGWLSFIASDLHPTIIEYIYKALPATEEE